ncbi:FAD-binding-3 domain-containing protein [Favolaschia claudopus]|uniref:FAD-binding-3 domain-containing protein n=1 Tax=Favolaschia claudopus TaxID=2862362 RepID=A0AAW0EF05_9AGAR
MQDVSCDVLVVGAGPSGLILALCLAMSNISVRIIDKEPSYRVGRRGAGITPRTLEVFKMLGVLDEVLKIAHAPAVFQSYVLPEGVKPLKTWAMSPTLEPTPSCPFLNAVFLGQDQVEGILRDHLKQFGCVVELGTQLLDFEQHSEHVSARVSSVENFIKAKYLVGADGAKGIVRKHLGLSFLGETRTEDQLIVSDVILDGLDKEHIHMWTKGPAATILAWPGQTTQNLFSVQMAGKELDRQKVLSNPEEFRLFLESHTGRKDIRLREIVWISEYIPNIRMVEEVGKDRVFIVGDAAHVHSLFGGQGMNSSVQDSFNLAWKLASVVLNLSTPKLLSTYGEERLPVIAEMLDKTTELHKKAFKSDKLDDTAHWKRNKSLDQLGVNYRWSSIVLNERPTSNEERTAYGSDTEAGIPLAAGDRAPDAPGLLELNGYDGARTLSLFDVFKYTAHTVLLFCPVVGTSAVHEIIDFLSGVSRKVQSVVVLPPGVDVTVSNEALFVRDEDGHGFRGYFAPLDCMCCVAVRPDGMVGAIVSGKVGLSQYLNTLSAS